MNVDFKTWFGAAGKRALRTLIQAAAGAALTAIGSATTMGAVNWLQVASSSALAAIISLLMSLTGLPELKGEEQENTQDEQ